MQILNRRVRDDIPLSPTEYAAWRRWSGLPPLPSSSAGKRRKKKKRRKRRLPRSPRPLLLGRACRRNAGFTGYDAPRVMFLFAVHVVRESGGAPVPFFRQCGGYSCYACRDVYPQCKLCRRPLRSSRCCSWTVPPPGIGGVGFGLLSYLDTKHTIYKLCLPIVRGLGLCMDFQAFSSGKYSWTCVSTVPVATPTVMSFTVPLVGCTIVATAICRDHVLFDGSLPCCGGVCVAMSCGGGFSLLVVLTIPFGTV